jgi:hypothetical protein
MTPQTINENVNKLLKVLDAEYEPIFLDLTIDPSAAILDCFENVSKKVALCGGRVIYGWSIWEHKHFIEAECHAVWEDKDENLQDITPKPNNRKNILFVEDDRIKYEEKQIANIRLNTSGNPLVDDLIATCNAYFRITNAGELAFANGDISHLLTDEQSKKLYYISAMKDMILKLLDVDGNKNSLCLCPKREKFKNCHGKDLVKIMNNI